MTITYSKPELIMKDEQAYSTHEVWEKFSNQIIDYVITEEVDDCSLIYDFIYDHMVGEINESIYKETTEYAVHYFLGKVQWNVIYALAEEKIARLNSKGE